MTVSMLERPFRRLVVVAALAAAGPALAQDVVRMPSEQTESGQVIPRRRIPPVPPRVDTPIDPELRARAKELLVAFASDPLSELRANAIEAATRTLGEEARPLALRGLSDDIVPVRFAAAVACGDLKYYETKQKLFKLAYEADPNVRLAARYALHKLGDTTLSQELVDPGLRDDRIKVRSNAVLLLGLLGEPSAITPLRKLLRDPAPAVRLQTTEALWRLGDDDVLEDLVGRTVSKFADDQVVAVYALSQRKNMSSEQRRGVSEQIRGFLVANFAEVELAAARGLGVLGSDAGYGVAMLYVGAAEPRQRALAALAFGDIGRSDAQPVLQKILFDRKERPEVRLAAATSILKLKAP